MLVYYKFLMSYVSSVLMSVLIRFWNGCQKEHLFIKKVSPPSSHRFVNICRYFPVSRRGWRCGRNSSTSVVTSGNIDGLNSDATFLGERAGCIARRGITASPALKYSRNSCKLQFCRNKVIKV
jgi:hypothetical protein